MIDASPTPLSRAARLLHDCERPLLFVGGRVHVEREVLPLAKALGSPVVLSPSAETGGAALGPRFIGRYSFGRRPGAEQVVERTDVVLGVNLDFSEFQTRGGRDFREQRVIHVFDDSRCFLRGLRPELSLRGDVRRLLAGITRGLAAFEPEPRVPWFEKPAPATIDAARANPGFIEPRAALRLLRKHLPKDVALATDIGGFTGFVAAELDDADVVRQFCPIELEGCMGEAWLTALGMQAADSNRRLIAIIGDGGFAMVPPELQRLAETRGRVTLILWENLGFQAVEEGFSAAFGKEHGLPSGTWRRARPDFVSVARGWGVPAQLCTDLDSLEAALCRAFAADGPSVVVLRIDPSVPSPMHDRFALAHEAR